MKTAGRECQTVVEVVVLCHSAPKGHLNPSRMMLKRCWHSELEVGLEIPEEADVCAFLRAARSMKYAIWLQGPAT